MTTSGPTLDDVARTAGVSRGTVSNVFNRPEMVRPALRDRVEPAARQLGYVLNGNYAEVVKIVEEEGAKVLLNTSGASLAAALESDAMPELVKPNLTEINGLLGTSFTTDDVDALREALAADDRFAGIPWVVVSMGAAGSVGFHEGRAFRAKTPAIAAVNATGSGDSTIAGFAHAIAAGADDVTVLKTANTCGKLNAMDPKTGHLVMDRWDEVYNSVVVTEL